MRVRRRPGGILSPVDAPTSGSSRPPGRRLAAIMFTDMVGYSALSERNEALAISQLAIQTRILEPILVVHGGRLVRTMGDGTFVEFGSAVSACRAALEIQAGIASHNSTASESDRFQIRIGLHIGDVEVAGDDLLGHGVNVAARLEPLADAGGICVSEDVERQVGNRVDGVFHPMGAQSLKNIGSIHAFRLKPAGAAATVVRGSRKASVPSIAVLPLSNLSPDSENEYFGDGLTEEILWALAKIRTLRVVSRTSCFALKGTKLSAGEVGRTLGVSNILEGSVRRAGSRVRVSVQLIDVAADRPLWSEKYDRELEDIFAIQEEITESVVEALQIAISEAERGVIGKIPTKSLDAYTAFLKSGRSQDVTINKATELLHEATRLDPEFARAHAALAFISLVQYRFYDSENRAHMDIARESAKRALDLDPETVEAHIVMAGLAEQEGRYDVAEASLVAALESDPRNFDALHAYGDLMHMRGDARKSSSLYLRAAEVQPDDVSAQALGSSRLMALDGLEAARPHLEEAVRRIERQLSCFPDTPAPYMLGAGIHLDLGQRERSLEFAEKAFELRPENGSVLYRLSCVYARHGDLERSIKMLQAANENGYGYSSWIRADADLDPIIDDPRVQELLEKMDARMAVE